MDRLLFEKFRKEYFKQLAKKPTWGRQSLIELFTITLNNVLLDNIEEDDEKNM